MLIRGLNHDITKSSSLLLYVAKDFKIHLFRDSHSDIF